MSDLDGSSGLPPSLSNRDAFDSFSSPCDALSSIFPVHGRYHGTTWCGPTLPMMEAFEGLLLSAGSAPGSMCLLGYAFDTWRPVLCAPRGKALAIGHAARPAPLL